LAEQRLDQTLATLRAAGHEVDGSTCDVTRPQQIRDLVRAAVERFGPIHVLVNNAGRSGGGTTVELADELWNDVIAANLTSVFLLCAPTASRAPPGKDPRCGRHFRAPSSAARHRPSAPWTNLSDPRSGLRPVHRR
jgi:NAD(P)-dependent dehydrogenase (short-subunit alcohol dehydrogenase family)